MSHFAPLTCGSQPPGALRFPKKQPAIGGVESPATIVWELPAHPNHPQPQKGTP